MQATAKQLLSCAQRIQPTVDPFQHLLPSTQATCYVEIDPFYARTSFGLDPLVRYFAEASCYSAFALARPRAIRA